MKKVYIITEDSYYWNMISGYSNNSSQVMFVFSSKQKALAQLDKINELNEDSCWWSEARFDALLCRETSDSNVVRQDCYSHVILSSSSTGLIAGILLFLKSLMFPVTMYCAFIREALAD